MIRVSTSSPVPVAGAVRAHLRLIWLIRTSWRGFSKTNDEPRAAHDFPVPYIRPRNYYLLTAGLRSFT